jgi:predicted metal-binding membrane protein
LLRHERWLLAGSVFLLAALAWLFLLSAAGMPSMQPPVLALIAMWWVMMAAMMLPSAAPAILLYAHVRRSRGPDAKIAQPWVFLTGYLGVWLLFSVGAALAQWTMARSGVTAPGNLGQSALLLAAGIYQLSPLKSACVDHCRSPAQFISRHWRSGWAGAVRLGLIHGAYCVGCCWLLMALLFVGGMMNLWWIVALTALVTAEKLLPKGEWVQTASGVALIGWGAVRLFG